MADERTTIYLIMTAKEGKAKLHAAQPGYLYYTTKEAAAKTVAAKLELSKQHDQVRLLAITGNPGDSAADIAATASETWEAAQTHKEESHDD